MVSTDGFHSCIHLLSKDLKTDIHLCWHGNTMVLGR